MKIEKKGLRGETWELWFAKTDNPADGVLMRIYWQPPRPDDKRLPQPKRQTTSIWLNRKDQIDKVITGLQTISDSMPD